MVLTRGLMGPLLKELGVEQLDGVDLSKMMLEKALRQAQSTRTAKFDLRTLSRKLNITLLLTAVSKKLTQTLK